MNTYNKIKCACKSKNYFILSNTEGEIIIKCQKCGRVAIKMQAKESSNEQTIESSQVN